MWRLIVPPPLESPMICCCSLALALVSKVPVNSIHQFKELSFHGGFEWTTVFDNSFNRFNGARNGKVTVTSTHMKLIGFSESFETKATIAMHGDLLWWHPFIQVTHTNHNKIHFGPGWCRITPASLADFLLSAIHYLSCMCMTIGLRVLHICCDDCFGGYLSSPIPQHGVCCWLKNKYVGCYNDLTVCSYETCNMASGSLVDIKWAFTSTLQ